MILTFLVNIIVGMFVGLSGIAGFLLPIFYIGVLKLKPVDAMSLSFAAFIVSGILGSINYHKKKFLDLKFASTLSIGSFIAAFLGVKLNLLISQALMSKILYIVVLFSGISILFRKNKIGKKKKLNNISLILIGFFTGLICSITGAGGPVLVVPILLFIGVEVHQAVAISLYNSIFIAIPSSLGYMLNSNISLIIKYLPLALVGHAIGVYIGSINSAKINKEILKKIIGILSIFIAVWKLFL